MEGIDSCIRREGRTWSFGRVGLQWDLQCTGGLKRFWARRARTSIDVLGLGVLVGRVAGFGVS
jgi:hypothetical protein